METNPTFGLLLIAIGALASGSFYLPLKYVRNWKWETGWIIQGLFAWVLVPWIVTLITVPHLGQIISESPSKSIFLPILFGAGWGIGGLTWGLSNRYLGIGLGTALPLGFTAALSTLITPVFQGKFSAFVSSDKFGLVLAGILIALAGIAIAGYAGHRKEIELNKQAGEKGGEKNFRKGITVALIAGIMSACFAFGEASGKAMVDLAESYNPGSLWNYNPVYAILLIGGFLFNFVYCMVLSVQNRSFSDYTRSDAPLKWNYLFAALAGTIWFTQFIFKGMGTTRLGEFATVSWGVFFSLVVVFSNLVGLLTGEWKGVSRKTLGILFAGLAVLIIAAILIGMGS
ncbi:MAG: L-rhamnose/proton symporter RhaT [Bacteroidales bacterium]